MPLNLTLTELGVGAVLLLPARCFSRWLSAGGKALAYRRPPSSLELKKKKKKASDWLSHPSRDPAVLARPASVPRLEAAVGLGLLRRCPLPLRRVGLCQPRVSRGAEGEALDAGRETERVPLHGALP